MTTEKDNRLAFGYVFIPAGHPNPPEPHEIDAAWIIARHCMCKIEFIVPTDDYMRSSLDIRMNGVQWEIKSPSGASRKHTVKDQFDRATKQGARNLVFDGRRTKLPDE